MWVTGVQTCALPIYNKSEEIYHLTPTPPSDKSKVHLFAKESDFETYALLVSWLRTNSIYATKDEVSPESSMDVEHLYHVIKKRKETN
jgi:hypothetical protein